MPPSPDDRLERPRAQSDELRHRLAVQLERMANVMEASAELAQQHAEDHRRRGRASEEVKELRRAQFAQDAARRARTNALRLAPAPAQQC
jgi:hypothetical protein